MTVNKFHVFLGLTLHTGTIKLPTLQDYCKKHRLLTTCLSNSMSRDRYLLIMRCFHFSKTWREGEKIREDRLFKVKPVIHHFNVMKKVYSPNKQLRRVYGVVERKTHLPSISSHKYGIKLYMVTEFYSLW